MRIHISVTYSYISFVSLFPYSHISFHIHMSLLYVSFRLILNQRWLRWMGYADSYFYHVFMHLFYTSLFIFICLFSYSYVSFHISITYSYISFIRLFSYSYFSFHTSPFVLFLISADYTDWGTGGLLAIDNYTSLFIFICLFSDLIVSFVCLLSSYS